MGEQRCGASSNFGRALTQVAVLLSWVPRPGRSDLADDRLGDKSRSGTPAVSPLVTDTRSANRALHVSVTHGRDNFAQTAERQA